MTLVAVDGDTLCVASAAVCQLNCKVVHKKSGRSKHFSSKKAFLEEMERQGREVDEEHFEFVTDPQLTETNDGGDIRWRAFGSVKQKIEDIVKSTKADDFLVVLGKGENYRHEVATTWPYKGHRSDKPILTDDVKDFVLNKYKDKAILAEGIEAEDVVGWYGYEAYQRAKITGKREDCDVIMAHVDKDVNQIPGWHFNYFKPDEGVFWIDNHQAWRHFFKQMLMGDKAVDNIPGLGKQSEFIQQFFGVRKGKGIGPTGADKILSFGETPREWWEIVVDCYKSCHTSNWREYLQEQAELLWIQKEKDKRISTDYLLQYFKTDEDFIESNPLERVSEDKLKEGE